MSTPRLTRVPLSAGRPGSRLGRTLHTPGGVTPSASQYRSASAAQLADLQKAWSALRNVSWTTYRVSPLHGLTMSNLSVHEADLKTFLTRELSNTLPNPEVDSCRIRPLSLDIERNVWALHVYVSYVANREAEKSPRVTIQAVLVSTLVAESAALAMGGSDFRSYPLMLIRSSAPHIALFSRWMERHFDCRVSPLSITPADLSILAKQWGHHAILDPTGKPMELTFAAPESVAPHLRKLSLSVGADSMQRLGHKLGTQDGSELYDAVLDQFSRRFNLQLSAFRLIRVGTQVAFIAAEGKAKFYDAGDLSTSLQVIERLVEIAAP